jgi:integrase/recombinase XerD
MNLTADWQALRQQFLEAGAVRGYSAQTLSSRQYCLTRFLVWCEERGLALDDLTQPVLERYQRHLHHAVKANGAPLSLAFQQQLLLAVKAFFRWAVRSRRLQANPAADLELPKLPKRLPRTWLSSAEIAQLLEHVAIYGEIGQRDRAIIETFYSTGLRRTELATLTLHDVDAAQGVVFVREGKGAKDRVVPIGERALAWLQKYREDVRPTWLCGRDNGRLWLRPDGRPLTAHQLGDRMAKLIREAGIDKPGACHIFRHTMATQMLEGGADVRYLQAMLGHAQLSTTAIYTQVAIGQLKAVHAATHPAAKLQRRERSDDLDGAA